MSQLSIATQHLHQNLVTCKNNHLLFLMILCLIWLCWVASCPLWDIGSLRQLHSTVSSAGTFTMSSRPPGLPPCGLSMGPAWTSLRGGWIPRSSVGREAAITLTSKAGTVLTSVCHGLGLKQWGQGNRVHFSKERGTRTCGPLFCVTENTQSKGPLPPCPWLVIIRRKHNLGKVTSTRTSRFQAVPISIPQEVGTALLANPVLD